MTYTEALEYLHSTTWLGSRLGLERTQDLLRRLGDPHKNLRYVHIAGTNGKGSTAAMLASILTQAGFLTGLATSPSLYRLNERMQVNGKPIGDEELAELMTTVKAAADPMDEPPTEFELITALSFLYFLKNHCDIVVLEVGLGGRLDSTNVIECNEAAVITTIGLDHTEFLGTTLEAIAREKAGIIKQASEVVLSGGQDLSVEKAVRDAAAAQGAHLSIAEPSAVLLREETI
ncbi:MAG: Mur ligase family protein, partial [Pygmaiobacter sp.]